MKELNVAEMQAVSGSDLAGFLFGLGDGGATGMLLGTKVGGGAGGILGFGGISGLIGGLVGGALGAVGGAIWGALTDQESVAKVMANYRQTLGK